jgi:hypothetical protein
MKRTAVTTQSASLELPQSGKTLALPFSNRKSRKQTEDLSNTYLRPTEELISYLNRIGQEYPFCVYYKEKTNDPL